MVIDSPETASQNHLLVAGVIRPVVWSLVPAEVFEGDIFRQVGLDLVESPPCKAFGGRGFVGDYDALVAFCDEFEVFVVVFPDGETMIEHIMNVLHHDVVEELEVHDHSFLRVSFPVNNFSFNRGNHGSPVSMQLVAKRETVGQRVAVIKLDFS